MTSIYEGFLRVLRSPLPTIAAVNGAAVGAGINLALACDVRIAGMPRRFDTRFVKIGLHPGGGHTWMLERAVGPQSAAAMVLFGAVVDGPRAVEIGLAWSCHPDDELVEAATEFAAGAARGPIPLLGRTKATLRQAPGSRASTRRWPPRSRIRPGPWARAGSGKARQKDGPGGKGDTGSSSH